MTWEETIQYIRTQPEYTDVVRYAYFDVDLPLNVERFKQEGEFIETLQFLKKYAPHAKTILDVGAGNGISAIAFALQGYEVTVVEPDPSETIGAGAINLLAQHYKLQNITVHQTFAEDIGFQADSFDVVYVRQAMHHAYSLEKFVFELGRVLKKGGLLLTIRDHVIFDETDKQRFLTHHPLQKFYGGENAFTSEEYRNAMIKAGLEIVKEIKYFDSIVNFFPLTAQEIENLPQETKKKRTKYLKQKIGFLVNIPFVSTIYNAYLNKKVGNPLDEKTVAGRMYSYIAIKK